MEEIRGRKIATRPVLVAVGVIVVAAVLAAVGLFRVGGGEAVVVKRGADVRLFATGWHWRAPFVGETLRVPVTPIRSAHDVTVQTREGAAVVIHVDGLFALEPSRARSWFAAAGWRPFLDGVVTVAGTSLTRTLGEPTGAELLSPGAGDRLAVRLDSDLTAAGARVEDLQVHVPQDENPAVAAVARTEAVKLARETGRRVVMVGWDAADWQLVQPLIDAGRMPNLAKLVAAGMSGSLRPDPPLLSPLIWTTFATGKRVSEHGIADFLVADTATGKRVPISSDYRKVHALWTALTALGRRTDVVGWWATWPAEPILGRMVTERVAYQLFGMEAGTANDGKVHPPELWPRIQRLIVGADGISYGEAKRFIDVTEAEYTQAWDSLPPERRQDDRINHLRKVLAATKTYQAIALELLDDPADLSLFYFEGTDTIGHLFAQFLPPRMAKVSEEDVRRFGKAMPEYYVWMDELLGQIMRKLRPEDSVMILSDHGFYTGELRPDSDPFDWETGAPQWHRQLGMIVFAGGGVPKGRLGEASMYDVAPTLLASLGLPVPEDMPGKPLAAALPPDVAAKPATTIASFEALPRAKATGVERSAEADKERMRELAALGYISPGAIDDDAAQTAAPPRGAADDTAPRTTPSTGAGAETATLVTQLGNLAGSLRREGRLEEAKAKYLEAIAIAPSYFAAYESVAAIFGMQGNHEEAFKYLALGFSRTPKMSAAALGTMVMHAEKCNRIDEAAEVLSRLQPFRGGEAELHSAWGRVYQLKKDGRRAVESYERALAIDPVDGAATQGVVEVLRLEGRQEEARATLQRGFAAAGSSIDALNTLTGVALSAGWADIAEPVLKKVLANDPGHSGVLFNLGVCQAQLGKNREAEESLRQSIERAPKEPAAYFNLGMVLGVEGRIDDALTAFRKANELGMNTAQLHVAMARAHFFKGDHAATVDSLKRALKVEPGNQEAQKLLALLRQHGVDTGGAS